MNADWIEADADEGALREAQARVSEPRYELWEGQRLVARVRNGSRE